MLTGYCLTAYRLLVTAYWLLLSGYWLPVNS